MIYPLLGYIIKAAFREKLFLAIVLALVVTTSLSVFFGATALTEQDQFVRTFSAYGFRLFGVVAIVLFIINHIRRSFETRDVDYLLSRPIGRVSFILTHAAAFSIIAIMAALLLGGTTTAMQYNALHSGVWLWWISLAAEFVIMANVAMFFAFVLSSPTICMVIVFAFYVLSRLIGEILGILHRGTGNAIVSALGKVMEFISIFIPRLDLMGQTKWLIYGVPPEISLGFVFGQCFVFVLIIIGASTIDLSRRQF